MEILLLIGAVWFVGIPALVVALAAIGARLGERRLRRGTLDADAIPLRIARPACAGRIRAGATRPLSLARRNPLPGASRRGLA